MSDVIVNSYIGSLAKTGKKKTAPFSDWIATGNPVINIFLIIAISNLKSYLMFPAVIIMTFIC